MTLDSARLNAALDTARQALLAERNADGHWTGELSSSALATATAVVALQQVQSQTDADHSTHIKGGLDWLAAHANPDGGWGDSTKSKSNISTTTLCWAAFANEPEKYAPTVAAANAWLTKAAGGTTPEKLAHAIIRRYGKDRTFSIPILTHCALAGKVDWADVRPLPFELAALPQNWFGAMRLPVVSYALPALIAIGQCRHHNRPTRNPITRILRNATRKKTLKVLERVQPTNGGFLEATPLTSFVTMSLAGSGLANHPVAKKGVAFILGSVRADGSWPIDTHLATWVTTLSVNALGPLKNLLPADERAPVRDWLLSQQYREVHPYTLAAPGGWAWTPLPGGVPDADDTPGALLALKNLGDITDTTREAARLGCKWLLDLQNRDGGIPTFCRGWTNLPFDRSSPDLTAHTMRAWLAWRDELPELQTRLDTAFARAARFLAQSEGAGMDGWAPLWFGNQHAPDEINWTYGTAKVLLALNEPEQQAQPGGALRVTRGKNALLEMQRADGAWGGCKGSDPSIEETALALEALAGITENDIDAQAVLETARAHGALWLVEKVENGEWTEPSPIGFYFAKLWYFEKLYPMIATVAALTCCRHLAGRPSVNGNH